VDENYLAINNKDAVVPKERPAKFSQSENFAGLFCLYFYLIMTQKQLTQMNSYYYYQNLYRKRD